MSARAWVLISCCTVSTSISLFSSSLTRRSRAVVSAISKTDCASSTFNSRFDAERSDKRPASSRFATIAITSGEILLPRFAAFSIEARTLRMSASTSRERSGAMISCIGCTRACRYSPETSTLSTCARDIPWTRMRMRPSGSFSILIITATVPT